MRITLAGAVYDYNERLTIKEAMVIKDRLGLTIRAFTEGLEQMDPYALAGLVWLLRYRAGETELDPRLVDFDLGDLDIVDPDATTKAEQAEAEAEGDPPVAAPEAAASTTPTIPPVEPGELAPPTPS